MDKITIISESYPWKTMVQAVGIFFLVAYIIICGFFIAMYMSERKLPKEGADKHARLFRSPLQLILVDAVFAPIIKAFVCAVLVAFMCIFTPPTWHQYHVDIDKSMTLEEFDDFCKNNKVIQYKQDGEEWVITTAGELPTE